MSDVLSAPPERDVTGRYPGWLRTVFTVGLVAMLAGLLGLTAVLVWPSAEATIAAGLLVALGLFIMGIMVKIAEGYP